MKIFQCPEKVQTHHISVCEHKSTVLIDWFNRGGRGNVHVRKMMLFDFRDVYMQMLLHIDDYFDDDFLLDCINVLTKED